MQVLQQSLALLYKHAVMMLPGKAIRRKMAMRFVAGVAITIMACGTARKVSEYSIVVDAGMHYVADGDNKEWPVPYPFIDNKEKIQYAIANNNTTLYITVKTSDAVCSRKLEKHGLILFIDSAAEKDKTMQLIALPENEGRGKDDEQDGPPGNSMLKPQQEERNMPRPMPQGVLPVKVQQMALIGFRKANGNYRQPHLAAAAGVSISCGVNEMNEMIWEVAIPFNLILKDSILYVDSGRHISVGIFMPALGAADMPVMNSPQAAGGGKGNFAGHGSGSRPPGGGGRGAPDNEGEQDATAYQDKLADDMDRLTKDVLVWRRVSLGYKTR